MAKFDYLKYRNLNPQVVSDYLVGKVDQMTPALMAQYDVNNDGVLDPLDQQIIKNSQTFMNSQNMQFADMNMPTITQGQQPQTIGEGQINYGNLNMQMAKDLASGVAETTPDLLKQYDTNQDGTVNTTDALNIFDQKRFIKQRQLSPYGSQAYNPQVQVATQSQAMPINNMGQGQVQQQQQPQTIGQGQPNYGNLNVQQALDLSTGASEMTPAFMKQYDLNQDGTVNITDVSNLITGKENIAKQNLSPYGSQVYNPQVQMATQSQAMPDTVSSNACSVSSNACSSGFSCYGGGNGSTAKPVC
jgi:hypothetical protein